MMGGIIFSTTAAVVCLSVFLEIMSFGNHVAWADNEEETKFLYWHLDLGQIL